MTGMQTKAPSIENWMVYVLDYSDFVHHPTQSFQRTFHSIV